MADVSPELRKIFEAKQKQRAALRHEFLKQVTNPHGRDVSEGGTIFDPALQRFQALRFNQYDYFKPNAKTGIYALYFLIPSAIFGYFVYRDRVDKETRFRTGQVSYADRQFKYV